MADYQRVVEFLRDIRQGPLQTVTDEITQAAADYAALCAQANERLRKCSSFLQQGLRGEAIHLADEPPNLLDLVAALDLPDAQTWIEFCQNNGLAVPPPLQIERASQLNDAYAADQPLEHLLARHRLLALSRGPVRERLGILRKIAAADGGSGAWEKDIRVFETARLKELPAAFYDAVKNRDAERISIIRTELTDAPWYEPVPADLTQAVEDAHARMQRAKVESELKDLIEPLRDAYAARSLKECQALVQIWKNIMSGAGVTSVSSQLAEEIKPVQAFIHETLKSEEKQKRFRESCRVFGQMLDRDQSDVELEAGYTKLREFNLPIPEELAQRYVDRKASRQKQIERKHKMNLAGVGATAAAVIVIGLVIFFIVRKSSEAERWAAKLRELTTAKRYAEVQTLMADLEKNHPSYVNESSVAGAMKEARALGADYDRQVGAMNALLINAATAEKAAGPVASNKAATLEELTSAGATLREYFDRVKNAGDLGWVDTDKKLQTTVSHMQEMQNEVLAQISSLVHAEVDALGTKVEGLPTSPEKSTETLGELAAVGTRLRDIQAIPDLDRETVAAAAALAKKVEDERASLGTARSLAGELENVRLQAVSADDLKRALASFASHYPDDSHSSDFSEALKRLDGAKGVEAWRDVAAPWARRMAPTGAAAAQKRIDAITGYLAANPSSPMTGIVSAYGHYLKRAVEALGEKGTWQEGLNDTIAIPLLSELSYMETSDGQKYLVMGELNRKQRRLNNMITVEFDAINPKDPSARVAVQVEPPLKLVTEKPVPMPHTKFVMQVADQVKQIDDKNWDTYGLVMAEQLVKDKEIDLAPKAMLLQQLLKIQQTVTGPELQDMYEQTLVDIARQKLTTDMLANPKLVTEGMKKALAGIIEAMPNPVDGRDRIAKAKARMFSEVMFDLAGTGVLLKDDHGNWGVSARAGVVDGNAMWTIVPATAPPTAATTSPTEGTSSGPRTSLLQIGTVASGKIQLDETALRGVPQGSIVFITHP